MAENAIQIIIDVLAKEGITSVNDFSKAAAGAMDVAGKLSVSVDDLDGSLLALSKSGLNARDMAAGMVTAFEDAGVVFKDDEGAVKILAGALVKLGVAGKEAASGIDLANKANEEFIGPSNTATDSIIRQGGAYKVAATDAGIYASAVKGLQVGMASSAIMQDAAIANLGTGYAKMTSLAEMATPALMKAATWAGIGLAGLAYEGIKQYTQFNKLITQTITQAGVAPSKMGFLTNLAETVAKSTGQGLTDVANTIYRAASGTASWNDGLGATNKQLTTMVTQFTKLNVLGNIGTGAESEQASRVGIALINSNIRGVGRSASKAAAFVNAQVGSGDIRMSDIVPAYGRGLLASAKANNLSAVDMASWVDTLTSTGMTGGIAGNYVKTGINLFANPSAQGTQVLSMIGVKPGEMENLLSGPGGLLSAAKTMKEGMGHLTPAAMATYFFNSAKPGQARPGGTGLAGAIAKLQTMSANELSPKFIKDWMANKLTSKEQTQAYDLILTKSFGGSKQFATLAELLNNLNLFSGIKAHMIKEMNPGYLHSAEARALATPAQQFARMKQSVIVDLVNMGKELTPLGLEFGHIMTGVIGGLTKFKGVIIAFVTMALGLLGVAGISKFATLATHLSPLIGAGYNRLGIMAGKDSKFTTAMNARANSGAFKFLNIYKTHEKGILSKLGGASINAGLTDAQIGSGATVAGLSTSENVLNGTMSRGNVLLERIAINTEATSGALSGSGASSGLKRGWNESASAYNKRLAAYNENLALSRMTPEQRGLYGFNKDYRTSMSGASSVGGNASMNSQQAQNVYFGQATKAAKAAEKTSAAQAEAFKKYNADVKSGAGLAKNQSYVDYLRNKSSNLDTLAKVGTTDLRSTMATEGGGLLSSIGGGLGSLAGGPFGMMAMMAAPMLMGLATPLIGKLGSLLGGWLSGGTPKPFHAHIKGSASDAFKASAEAQKALKALHQFYTGTKSKSGKVSWALNEQAVLANSPGYDEAKKRYELAAHIYTGSMRHSEAIGSQATSTLYGVKGRQLANALAAAKKLSGHTINLGPRYGKMQVDLGTEAQMRALAMNLPDTLNAAGREKPLLRRAVLKMMTKNGANWQDFTKIINKDKSLARGVFADIVGSSKQTQDKHYGLTAALISGGYFDPKLNLATTRSGMHKLLNDKKATVAEVVQDLPRYAHNFHLKYMEDSKALLTKLSPDARKYFQDQKAQADEGRKKVDALIGELRKAAKDTHLSGASVSKLAKENAAALAAIGLTPTMIGAALAAALSPYLKTSGVVATGGTVTRSIKWGFGPNAVGGP